MSGKERKYLPVKGCIIHRVSEKALLVSARYGGMHMIKKWVPKSLVKDGSLIVEANKNDEVTLFIADWKVRQNGWAEVDESKKLKRIVKALGKKSSSIKIPELGFEKVGEKSFSLNTTSEKLNLPNMCVPQVLIVKWLCAESDKLKMKLYLEAYDLDSETMTYLGKCKETKNEYKLNVTQSAGKNSVRIEVGE